MFRHPAKRDLYIALADRWMVDLPEQAAPYFADGRLPFRFDGPVPRLDWRDDWSPEEFG